MLYLTKSQTNFLYLTLTEKELLVNPNYLFVFKNRSSNQIVSFIKLNATDVSLFKERYNKFQITTNTYFANQLTGQWIYEVYEQASTTNTNPTGLNLLESGIMILSDTQNVYSSYNTNDTYKIRR
jgi:hypothetical protein